MDIYSFDFGILDFIRENFVCAFLDIFLKIFTYAGENGAVWIVIGICMLVSRSKDTRKTGIMIAVMLIMTALFGNVLLKGLIARPRPFIQRPEILLSIAPPSGYSFPSGHSLAGFGCATVLGSRIKKKLVRAGVWITAVLIAFSRLYFYVHFPTDVLAGATLGVVLGLLSVKIIEKIYEKKRSASE